MKQTTSRMTRLLTALLVFVLAFGLLGFASPAEQEAGEGAAGYQVEFTYGEAQYVLPGDQSAPLADVLNTLGLSGEVTAAEVSDDTLFSVSNESGEWVATALQAFTSEEWLRLTIDGEVYEIVVTDDGRPSYIYDHYSGKKYISASGMADGVVVNFSKLQSDYGVVAITWDTTGGGKGFFIYKNGQKIYDYSQNVYFTDYPGNAIFDGNTYKVTGHDTYPYKLYLQTISAGSISYATTAVSKTPGDAAFTNPLTKTGDGAVTYSSSNTSVATVNESTGEVTIVAQGEATITATVSDSSTYVYDTKTASYTLTVSKSGISPTVTMESWTYGDTASEPVVSGNAGNGTVSYQYKVSTASDDTYSETKPSDAGTYTVKATIAETATYNSGTATAEFTIAKATPTYIVPTGLTAIYGQTLENVTLQEGWNWEDSTASVGNVGTNTFKASYTPSDTTNYNTVTDINVSVTVSKATITPSVSITGWTYGETANTPSVSGNTGSGDVSYQYKLKTAEDSAYTATAPTNAGEYTVKATIADTENYSGSTAVADFTISKATPSYTVPTGLKAISGKKLSTITLPDGWTWVEPETAVGTCGDHTYKATFTPTDTKNYNSVDNADVTVTVNPSVQYKGAGLRRRVKIGTTDFVNTSTDLRIVFDFDLPAGAEISTTEKSYFSWDTGKSSFDRTTVVAKTVTDQGKPCVALIVTGVPQTAYNDTFHCKVHLTYTVENVEYTLDSDVGDLTVTRVCNAFLTSQANTTWARYADYLLGNTNTYTLDD